METNLEMIQNALLNGFDLFLDAPINADSLPQTKSWTTVQLSRIRIAQVEYKQSTSEFVMCRLEGFNDHILIPYKLVSIALKENN